MQALTAVSTDHSIKDIHLLSVLALPSVDMVAYTSYFLPGDTTWGNSWWSDLDACPEGNQKSGTIWHWVTVLCLVTWSNIELPPLKTFHHAFGGYSCGFLHELFLISETMLNDALPLLLKNMEPHKICAPRKLNVLSIAYWLEFQSAFTENSGSDPEQY